MKIITSFWTPHYKNNKWIIYVFDTGSLWWKSKHSSALNTASTDSWSSTDREDFCYHKLG